MTTNTESPRVHRLGRSPGRASPLPDHAPNCANFRTAPRVLATVLDLSACRVVAYRCARCTARTYSLSDADGRSPGDTWVFTDRVMWASNHAEAPTRLPRMPRKPVPTEGHPRLYGDRRAAA